MLYGFLLFIVIALGIVGFFSVALTENTTPEPRTISLEYEIIEDNE